MWVEIFFFAEFQGYRGYLIKVQAIKYCKFKRLNVHNITFLVKAVTFKNKFL